MTRRPKTPNRAFATLLTTHGVSHKSLAFRVNQLAAEEDMQTSYNHSSVARWIDGSVPKDPVPRFIARALGERLGRTVTVGEIGMAAAADEAVCWDFPRDRAEAVGHVLAHWSTCARPGGPFAVRGYHVAVTRWLAVPADRFDWPPSPPGHQSCPTRTDEIRQAAEQARQWDTQFGGGNTLMQSASRFVRETMPLLATAYDQTCGQPLLSTLAELVRTMGWAAFDNGHSVQAQQCFIQALRLARAGQDVEMGAYVLATMALHTLLEGAPDEALDMAQGAYYQGRHHASRRVLAFAKLAEARALARLGDATGATTALSRAESWLDKITPETRDPAGSPTSPTPVSRRTLSTSSVTCANPAPPWPGTPGRTPSRTPRQPAPWGCAWPPRPPRRARPGTSNGPSRTESSLWTSSDG
ncbi:hypothetical protein [Streptomyces sp. NPDC088789]|uniref:hypothetical protein n=1 Tax=Streptomyces sp. NPDC088789 TaxID=3365899 RepID=UPI00381F0AD7